MVRTLEAAVRKGNAASVSAVAETLLMWVKLKSRLPTAEQPAAAEQAAGGAAAAKPPAKWSLEAAGGELGGRVWAGRLRGCCAVLQGRCEARQGCFGVVCVGASVWRRRAPRILAAALELAQLGWTPPPPPSAEGLSAEAAAAAAEAHVSEVAAAEALQRRRVAAVLLLQRRLPALVARKRALRRLRADRLR